MSNHSRTAYIVELLALKASFHHSNPIAILPFLKFRCYRKKSVIRKKIHSIRARTSKEIYHCHLSVETESNTSRKAMVMQLWNMATEWWTINNAPRMLTAELLTSRIWSSRAFSRVIGAKLCVSLPYTAFSWTPPVLSPTGAMVRLANAANACSAMTVSYNITGNRSWYSNIH